MKKGGKGNEKKGPVDREKRSGKSPCKSEEIKKKTKSPEDFERRRKEDEWEASVGGERERRKMKKRGNSGKSPCKFHNHSIEELLRRDN